MPVVSTVIKVSRLVISELLDVTVTVIAFLYCQSSLNQGAARVFLAKGPNRNNSPPPKKINRKSRLKIKLFLVKRR